MPPRNKTKDNNHQIHGQTDRLTNRRNTSVISGALRILFSVLSLWFSAARCPSDSIRHIHGGFRALPAHEEH